MSEEKPTFKITDRRLFNSDGTPREGVERAEEAAATPPAAEPPRPQASTGAGAQQAETAGEAAAGAARGERDRQAAAAEETSQELLMLVEFVASFAADAMGMVGHPGEVGQETNLPLARQCIDMLGALRQKTSGRLSPEEQRFLDTILSQLRMQYVSLTSAPRGPQQQPSPRGGFSGSDITGGR